MNKITKKKLTHTLLGSFLFLSLSVLAEPTDKPTWSPIDIMPQPVVANATQQISTTKQTGGIQLTQQDLEKNLALTENLINQALVGSQWDLLADLLLVYQRIPHADINLYRYAKGALLRTQRKHHEAIQNYHDILVANPDLPYVRFDYMAMLFENKQFKQAQKENEKLSNTPLPIGLQQLIQQYQQAMKNAQSWQFDGNLLYEKTNNVNNASDQREIRLGNRTFIRDEKALPQSANGLRYAASLTRAKNLGGNHFIFSKIGADGIYYWDNRKYNEERTKLQLGYQYQDIVKSFRLLPTVEFEWYSGHFYNRKYGLLTQYSQWLSSHWQVNLSLARYWRYYVNKHHANSYNGTQNQATLILAWNPMPELVIYGGGDWSRQYARDRQESYIRKGLQLGVSYEWQEKIGFSLDARYGTRLFGDEHFLFPITRKDKEKQMTFKLWSPMLQWQGIMPKLSYQRLNIDSNIPAFYQRKNNQVSLEIEKRF